MKSLYRGFDEFLGFSLFANYLNEGDPIGENCYLNDFFDDFLRTNIRYHVEHNGGDYFEPGGYMTDYLADEAVNVIEANKENPFFLFLSFTAVHSPLTALKTDYDALSYIENHCDRVYAAMIVALDRAVGKVLQAVKDSGVEDNTLIIFTSDNGAPNFINRDHVNSPYRGWKASFFEGGLHVPMFMQWPAKIQSGISRDAIVSHVDLFPGILAAAGLSVEHDIDGLDFLPLVTTEDTSASSSSSSSTSNSAIIEHQPPIDYLHETLFWRADHYLALRKNGWKLHVVSVPEHKVWLYNLLKDKGEKHNLASLPEFGDILTALLDTMHRINATQIEPLWPTLSCTPILIDKLFADAYIVGDTYVYWPN
jgi:arylsulfatase A-like enzyme